MGERENKCEMPRMNVNEGKHNFSKLFSTFQIRGGYQITGVWILHQPREGFKAPKRSRFYDSPDDGTLHRKCNSLNANAK